VLPYLHLGVNPDADPLSATFDTLVVLGGKKKQFPYRLPDGGTYLVDYFFGMGNDAWSTFIRSVEAEEFADFAGDGMYFDEFSSGARSEYAEGTTYWDQASVVIDTSVTPNVVASKVVNLALANAALRDGLIDTLLAQKKVVWANWEPTTEHDVDAGLPQFVEFPAIANASRAHLASPLAYVGFGITTPRSMMNNIAFFLRMGVLPGFYATAELTEAPIAGDIFPITPKLLTSGVVAGEERIVTARSGTFGFGNASRLAVTIYDVTGAVRCTTTGVLADGTTTANVSLGPGEVAIVAKAP
jgi:hypothetical protein